METKANDRTGMRKTRAAFFDRDGIINEDTGYASDWGKIEMIESTILAMRSLKQAGFQLFIITNQSGLARGFFTLEQFNECDRQMRRYLSDHGAGVEKTYFCPHLPEGSVRQYSVECDCRKPKPGLILKAAMAFDLDLETSILFGDNERDVAAGLSAGVGANFLVGRAESVYGNSVRCGTDVPDCLQKLNIEVISARTEQNKDG